MLIQTMPSRLTFGLKTRNISTSRLTYSLGSSSTPMPRRHPLPPVGRRGDEHVNALIRQLGTKLGTVPKRNPINQIGTNLALPHPPSAPADNQSAPL